MKGGFRDADPPVERVVFGVLYAADGTQRAALDAVAREFSPRVEWDSDREITLELSGLARLFGDARTIAQELRRTAADRGVRVRVAIAGTRSAARLIVRHRAGITIIDPGTEASVLAPLPLTVLADIVISHSPPPTTTSELPTPKRHASKRPAARDERPIDTLRQWGLRTLGELAALPPDDVAARLGQQGIDWQRLARGDDPRPLVPAVPEERFEQALDLEWPIDGLEPLSFVLGRLIEPLSAHLERRDRGAAVLHVRLRLVTKVVHERSLQLPAPMRDARALRTLALLDLESHPPAAAIDRVMVAVDPTPGRVVQFSLLTRPLPSPEQLSTLMARLTALMGEGRCGAPAIVDTWQPGAFAMQSFAPRDSNVVQRQPRSRGGAEIKTDEALRVAASPRFVAVKDVATRPVVALRRFRIPIPARVRVEDGKPVRVTIDRRGYSSGPVECVAGPWRTSGGWWAGEPHSPHAPYPPQMAHSPHAPQWDRDEWDVALHDGTTYRVFRERDRDAWYVEGVVD
jgi:protein ImuB